MPWCRGAPGPARLAGPRGAGHRRRPDPHERPGERPVAAIDFKARHDQGHDRDPRRLLDRRAEAASARPAGADFVRLAGSFDSSMTVRTVTRPTLTGCTSSAEDSRSRQMTPTSHTSVVPTGEPGRRPDLRSPPRHAHRPSRPGHREGARRSCSATQAVASPGASPPGQADHFARKILCGTECRASQPSVDSAPARRSVSPFGPTRRGHCPGALPIRL